MDAEATVDSREEWSFLIEPEPGASLWQALADAAPVGFDHIHIYPNRTARIYLTERVFDA
jgi:hypothetical protein